MHVIEQNKSCMANESTNRSINQSINYEFTYADFCLFQDNLKWEIIWKMGVLGPKIKSKDENLKKQNC